MDNFTAAEADRLIGVVEREVAPLDIHQRIVLAREIEEALRYAEHRNRLWGNDYAD